MAATCKLLSFKLLSFASVILAVSLCCLALCYSWLCLTYRRDATEAERCVFLGAGEGSMP